MKAKKILTLFISICLLLAVIPSVYAADSVTIKDQISISNVLRTENPMYIENVPVYICQAPVTVTLLKDSTTYAVSDLIVDDEGAFFPSVGYLPDGGTHDEYWEYEKKQAFPKGLTHTLTNQSNPFYVTSTVNGKNTVEAIILIERVQPMNPSNWVERYDHILWSSTVPNDTMTISGLYDITYNKKGDMTFIIDTNSSITINRTISALYIDSTLCTEASSLCTPIVYNQGTYQDNQFWYDSNSPLVEQSYIAPGTTIKLTQPGNHTVTVSLGYQSKDERIAIQNADSVVWQNAPRVLFQVLEATPTAKYTDSTVLINGVATSFEAYNIADNNYFKLRDLAKVVSGSKKQFEVTWNKEAGTIDLISGKSYTEVGGELAPGNGEAKPATLCTSKIYKDGQEVNLKAYNINSNNYFKLRDLGQAFDFDVSWNGAENCITVETDKSYTAD